MGKTKKQIMAKSVVAFSLEEFDPSYTRVLVGDAIFRYTDFTNLGTLEVITGIAVFRNSQVEDLGNLTTIGGYADFDGSKVENLGNLTTIGRDAIFRNSQVENLGNLTTIGRNADFYGNEKLKNLGNLTTIRGYANFIKSQVKNLGNLTIIYGDADFRNSQVKDLGNLTTIYGDALFVNSQVKDLGKLKTIKGFVSFDNQELADQWKKRSNKDNFKTGGQSLSKTPAPKKDRVYGSKKNKPESSKDTKSAEKIEFNEKTLETIKNKVAEHNKKNPKKKVTLASAKAVVRRGMGAYSSTHRPTISGGKPNSRVAWGLARLNAFFYKIINGKSKSGKYIQDDDLINELGYKVKKYADGGEVANIMRNEIIDILYKNAQYGKQIHSVQEVGLEVIESCIESNTYFGNAIRQANENYIMIPVNYEDKLWGIDKKVGYVYFAKPNENTKIRVEYKYDMQDYPVPILFDSEIMNSEEFYDFNDYEEIKSYKFDSEFLYRGINNDEMLSIIKNGFIKSNASMNIGKQQQETTSFAQHISQASSYAVGFNAWYDEVTFAKPKYILKVKKEGVNYKPTIETDIENEVDVYGEIPIQQIESIYEFRLGECEMGQVEIRVGYDNDFSDGSRSPMFKKVFVRKTDINSLIKSNKVQKYSNGGLIAPNGKPSNLTPEQYKLVRTKAFKDWFGDWENDPENASKIVDENGEPLPVYHGSRSKFDIFDIQKSGESNTTSKVGFWFTSIKMFAENFANSIWYGKSENEVIYSVFLSVKNPKIYESEIISEKQKDKLRLKISDLQNESRSIQKKWVTGDWDYKDRMVLDASIRGSINEENFNDYLNLSNKSKDAINDGILISDINKKIKNIENKLYGLTYNDSYEKFRTDIYKVEGKSSEQANMGGLGMALSDPNGTIKKYVNSLKNKGNDGIIIKKTRFDKSNAGGLNDQYVAFEPNQIKLADGTNTTFDSNNLDIRFMAGGQVLNLNKIRKGQYEAKSDKIEISLTNPKVLNGMGTNKWQLIIEYSNDIIVNQWFDTMNEALKTGAILLSDFLDSNNTETRFMAGGRTKKAKTDRSGNPIGDGNFHVDYFVEDMTEYPQVKISVSKSDSTESVYVRYFNEDNAESITLRFSMHENNAVKFGYQLNGYTASKNDILYELGLINRKFVPNTYLSITKRQVKKVDLPKYEESNLSIKEMYDLGEGADISMHKGKIAKGSNYLIQGDTVEKIIADTGRFEYFVNGGVPKKVKFDIEEDEDEDRTEISINGVGKVILTMTYPEYEFMDDIGEDGLEELGIEEGEIIGKIEHIEINDKYKGQGYAKLLMNKAIEIAEEKGLMPLYLNASPMGYSGLDIDDLTAFYESFGFQVFLEQGNNNLMILK